MTVLSAGKLLLNLSIFQVDLDTDGAGTTGKHQGMVGFQGVGADLMATETGCAGLRVLLLTTDPRGGVIVCMIALG
jgi:hypothetical protein